VFHVARADKGGVKARFFVALILGTVALSVGSASAHSIPQKWWLDEQTAFGRLKAMEGSRSTKDVFSGRCRGAGPRAVRSGRPVYKHFNCSARSRVNGVTFTFLYRVHVTGPRGRIKLGGAW
jgi:hypothetical protein